MAVSYSGGWRTHGNGGYIVWDYSQSVHPLMMSDIYNASSVNGTMTVHQSLLGFYQLS